MITASSFEEFKNQFSTLLKDEYYSKTESVVYIWKVEKPIPRLIGESNILYIGRTKNSFSSRYSTKKAMEIELGYYESVYQHVIQTYGSISIEIRSVSDTKLAETIALHEYFNCHRELPPMNRSMPKLN